MQEDAANTEWKSWMRLHCPSESSVQTVGIVGFFLILLATLDEGVIIIIPQI